LAHWAGTYISFKNSILQLVQTDSKLSFLTIFFFVTLGMSHSKDVTECKNLVEYCFFFFFSPMIHTDMHTYIHWVSSRLKNQKKKRKKKRKNEREVSK
jgi:uncharacterized metal-binding protein